MAIKDLPGSFALDVLNLIAQAPAYVQAFAEKKAGSKPRISTDFRGNISINAQGSVAALTAWYNSYIKPNVIPSKTDTATIGPKFKSIADWENSFFVIRTQVIGVVSTPDDPAIVALDDVWKKFQSITGRWGGR